MTDRFDKPTLTRIINSGYPVEAKVTQIIALHELQRMHQLNEISNEIGHVIDAAKGN
ncbi:hypothetical protein K3F51_03965 [Limosilactobacillus reuteri]|uniref:hypothetical protein n=1 Tax=Limosilactobacillus reuteri TaxID=1598 RepID=UPI001CBF4E2B|nr:hypothetical protein [Limosilactobacillus reuteri]UAW61091.1 hypothetical protein K3F51_03965 [Limosilactobacillus reuteri]